MFLLFVSMCAFIVASVAAYFSVKGIGLLFAGAMVETMVMAGSLEAGKICITGFLYRYWGEIPKFLKIYLFIAVFVLMAITSLGIYGFLSAAYQKSASEYGIFSQKIVLLEKQKGFYDNERQAIEKRIESLMENRRLQEESSVKSVSGASDGKTSSSNLRRMQETTAKLIDGIVKDIDKEKTNYDKVIENIKGIDLQILELKTQSETNKDILTFQFIADSMGMPLDTVVKWFILVIIVVFDPLAIGLVLAYNIIVMKNKTNDGDKSNNNDIKKTDIMTVDELHDVMEDIKSKRNKRLDSIEKKEEEILKKEEEILNKIDNDGGNNTTIINEPQKEGIINNITEEKISLPIVDNKPIEENITLEDKKNDIVDGGIKDEPKEEIKEEIYYTIKDVDNVKKYGEEAESDKKNNEVIFDEIIQTVSEKINNMTEDEKKDIENNTLEENVNPENSVVIKKRGKTSNDEYLKVQREIEEARKNLKNTYSIVPKK